MVKRTDDPRQLELVLVFPEPIAALPVPTPTLPTPGMPVHLHNHGDVISVVCAGEQIGIVEPKQIRTLSNLLGRIDVEIEAVLGEAIEGGLQIIVHWRTDESTHRSLVRCVRPAGDNQLAA